MTATASADVEHVVTSADTADALGSGDLPVLATPRLLAWCEEATCAALDLDGARTSVGVRIELEHLAATAVGRRVTARAQVVDDDGRRVTFAVEAHDERGTLLCRGRVERAVVDRERFLSRVDSVD